MFKNFFKILRLHTLLIISLTLLIILRIPSFFEPYWYGDETMYLTIGNAINEGQFLYLDIFDHKTPFIYYLARVPNQLYFRAILAIWMLITTIAYYYLAKKLLPNNISQWLAMIIFVLFTTLPTLEGNIPNGELFMMGFVLLGAVIIFRNPAIFKTKKNKKFTTQELLFLFVSGCFFGMGILTKITALFDALAFYSLFFFFYLEQSLKYKNILYSEAVRTFILHIAIVGAGIITPIVISLLYFTFIGAFTEYLNSTLLYNFYYSSAWELEFDSALLMMLFTVQAKLIIAISLCIFTVLLSKKLHYKLQFIIVWAIMTTFSAALSNRPYPHYLLQTVPPLSLLIGSFLTIFFTKNKTSRTHILQRTIAISLFLLLFFMIIKIEGRAYSTISYYQRWWSTFGWNNTMSISAYNESFDILVADNYQVAPLIAKASNKKIFIWGNNPPLYALSETTPVGRFTISFHIRDFDAHNQTMTAIKQEQPEFIIVMHNERDTFPELNNFIALRYYTYRELEYYTVYKIRIIPESSQGMNPLSDI